jgi:putative ABC transport system permease protein
VVLLANTGSGGINAIEVKVVGIFATITKAYDDFALRIPLKTSQQLLRVTGVHTWLVLLERTGQTDNFLDKLRPLLKTPGLSIVPWYETSAADFYNKTVSLFSKQVLVVKLMIAFIIVLSISNTMMTNVRERYGEIGTLMALGDTRSKVLRRFLAEGAVLGFAGGVIGSVLGVGAARFISWVGIPMPPPPGMANSFVAGIMVTPGLVFEAIFLSVTTAVLAGLYPAWKASRLNIVDALRHAR